MQPFSVTRPQAAELTDSAFLKRALLVVALSLLVFGAHHADYSPAALVSGLGAIVVEPDILINDYVARAGLGPAFFNAGLLALGALILVVASGVRASGPVVAAVFTVAGFSLFGKNAFNVLPVAGGVAIYSLVSRRPFTENIIVALFGTALAPTVSEFAFGLGIATPWNIVLGVFAGLASGFILPPIARNALDFTRGYNLYNIGFAAGFVGTVAMSLLRAFDLPLSGGFAWAEEGPERTLPFLAVGFALLAVAGVARGGKGVLASWLGIVKSSGRLVSDFARVFGAGPTLFNMGVMGLVACGFVLAIGGDWNGPVIGGILTIAGFSAFGKHPLNALPPMVGAAAAAWFTRYGLDAPTSQLAVLFSATLAPIAGAYGPVAGLVAGVLHLALVVNVGVLHGGLNLYNNGFSGGMVAGILVPVLDWLREGRRNES